MVNQERFERQLKFHEWMLKVGNVYLHSNNLMDRAYDRVE